MITGVSIEVTKVRVLCQPFKHLVDEGKREVIFPGCLVEHPVIDTNSPSGHCPLRYELVPLITDYRHASLLWDYLDWADHSLSCTGYIMPACSNLSTSFLTTSLIASLSRR
jgi:hypothetical protein